MAKRDQILAKYDGECCYCGVDLTQTSWHVEHQTPKTRGGTDDLSNLVPACRRCNIDKGTRTAEEYRDALRRRPADLIRKAAALVNRQRAFIDGGIDEYDLVLAALELADLIEKRDVLFCREYGEPPFPEPDTIPDPSTDTLQ